MVKKTAQAFSLIMVIALITLAAFSVVAGGDETGGGENDDEGVVMRHLHALGEKLHGLHGSGHGAGHHGGDHHGAGHHGAGHHGAGHHGGGHMAHVAHLVEELNLTEDQHAHLERVHEIMGEGHGSMAGLHEQLMGEVEDGYVDAGGVRQIIDQHVEGMRTMAYGISDELVALINGLDAEQRETLMTHLEEARDAS